MSNKILKNGKKINQAKFYKPTLSPIFSEPRNLNLALLLLLSFRDLRLHFLIFHGFDPSTFFHEPYTFPPTLPNVGPSGRGKGGFPTSKYDHFPERDPFLRKDTPFPKKDNFFLENMLIFIKNSTLFRQKPIFFIYPFIFPILSIPSFLFLYLFAPNHTPFPLFPLVGAFRTASPLPLCHRMHLSPFCRV